MMTTKQIEALKLAQDLRALADRFSEGWHDGIKIDASDIVLLSDAAEALAEQPAQEEPVAGVVIREGLPTLLQDRHIKPTDQRLYTSPPPSKLRERNT